MAREEAGEAGLFVEVYRLTLEHFIDTNVTRSQLEEPLVVQMAYDRRYTPSAICLNSMIDSMRDVVLKRATEGVDNGNTRFNV